MEARKEVVRRIELGTMNVTTASREYGVSQTAIYKWLNQYSRTLKSSQMMIMGKKDLDKDKQALENELQKVYAELAKKQLQVEIMERVVAAASREIGYDLKKKCSPGSLGGTPIIETNTDTP
jgi:transposase-like protein